MNARDREIFDELAAVIKIRYPEVKIRYKCDHWYWKLVPKKFRAAGSVLGNTIWLQDRETSFGTLAHEYQHIVDTNDMGRLAFITMYLAPQILALIPLFFVALSIYFSMPLFIVLNALATLLCLAPLPAPGRAWLELRGYSMGLFLARLRHGENSDYYSDFVVDAMTGWLYYKMIWSRRRAWRMVEKAAALVEDSKQARKISRAFEDVYKIVNSKTVVSGSR
jgi:hypothetical protein